MARRRFKRGSTLRDLQMTGGQAINQFVPRPAAPPPSSGIGGTGPGSIPPGSLQGNHYGETRNVMPFGFDDSIDPSFPLDCFFQMPTGVLKIYSAKLWVKPAPFRAYETAATLSGGDTTSSNGGSSTPTSSSDSFSLGGASPSSSGGDGTHSHDAHSSHGHDSHGHDSNHTGHSSELDPSYDLHDHGTGIGESGSFPHSHNAHAGHSDHQHNSVSGGTHSSAGSHTHTIGHGHSVPGHNHNVSISSHSHQVDTSHTHGITYGIFESAAATGTLDAKVADDGTTFGSSVASGSELVAVDLSLHLTTDPGDRQLRIETSGANVQARVKVLLILDLLIKVDIE